VAVTKAQRRARIRALVRANPSTPVKIDISDDHNGNVSFIATDDSSGEQVGVLEITKEETLHRVDLEKLSKKAGRSLGLFSVVRAEWKPKTNVASQLYLVATKYAAEHYDSALATPHRRSASEDEALRTFRGPRIGQMVRRQGDLVLYTGSSSGVVITPRPNPDSYFTLGGILVAVSSAVSAYHGVKRNHGSIGWGLAWGAAGAVLPIVVPVLAYAQGFARPE